MQGLRRLLLIQGDVEEASALFDQEIELAEDTRAKARLYYEKGRAREDLASDLEGARACYLKATQLDQSMAAYYQALEQMQFRFGAFAELAAAREGNANSVRGDSRHRAAIIAERARLLETRLDDIPRATELYEQALDLDPGAASAQQALKRLLYEQNRWR
jgi:tetratricopeptide (TPR) repeat protein